MSDCQTLTVVKPSDIADLCDSLQRDGFTIFKIGMVADPSDFFLQAKVAYPLDPPLSGIVHWDAFLDSLWGGLILCSATKVALVVEDATMCRFGNEKTYDIALKCMVDACKGAAGDKGRLEGIHAKYVVLIGTL